MADLSKVVKVTQVQYLALLAGTTVSGETYDPNAIYLVDEDVWHYRGIDNSSTNSLSLTDDATYLIEAENTYGKVSFGLVTANSESSSSYPITAFSSNRTSTSGYTTCTLVKLNLYRTAANTYNATISQGTAISSLTSNTSYTLRFRRVDL